jgi:hypothetical protein
MPALISRFFPLWAFALAVTAFSDLVLRRWPRFPVRFSASGTTCPAHCWRVCGKENDKRAQTKDALSYFIL